MKRTDNDWEKFNQRYLLQSIQKIKHVLEIKTQKSVSEINEEEINGYEEIIDEKIVPSLEQVCFSFALSSFERDILLLCAAIELDPCFGALCALAHEDDNKKYPTFSLAMKIFGNSHWNAFLPSSPLRRWQLIEIGNGMALTLSPLKINERILHCLIGIQHLDEQLSNFIEPVYDVDVMVDSHWQIAQKVAQTYEIAVLNSNHPIIQLTGESTLSKRGIAYSACQQMGLSLYLINAEALPATNFELNQFLKIWNRECILSGVALILELDDNNLSYEKTNLVNQLVEKIRSPLIISTRERIGYQKRSLINIDVHKPTSKEQTQLWHQILSDYCDELDGYVEKLVCQFNLEPLEIESACTSTFSQNEDSDIEQIYNSLWDACRVQARPRMESLAQRINPKAGWDDLILPEAQKETLKAIVAHVKQRAKVYETWGFAKKSDRGLGISALFSGPSGTGKTTAAEVLAQQLNLDLYRIDLSSVVSKYIGETEKNLRRVFDAAESGGAILLFDEADALFGKRSEVKDSHDRHANIEVSYLLQRMEAYRGLAILTTNLKNALDVAFMRRIRFVVQFSFPDTNQRAEIWRRAFPEDTPTEGLDVKKLAKLTVAGGNIRNIALNAAFIAAESGEAVMMKHLLIAARSEHSKLDKPLVDSQVKGWI